MGNLADTGDILEEAASQAAAPDGDLEKLENPTELVDNNGQIIKLNPNSGTVINKPLGTSASNYRHKRKVRLVLKKPSQRKIRLTMKKGTKTLS